jgi:putative transposase
VRRHNQPVALLVTVCVHPRRDLLADAGVQHALTAAWTQAANWRVGEYTIMPDHVHLFCTPADLNGYPVRRWVGYWKRLAGNAQGTLKRCFQEDCWDTQMRDQEHYEEKLSYVRMNPVRRGLAQRWEDWPFRGKAHEIVWL